LHFDQSIDLRSSIIGDNTGIQLTEAPVGSPDAFGNFIGGLLNGVIDPRLGPLTHNGGPTMTHALLPGSPAIEMGDPTAMVGVNGVPMFDQRGEPFARVFDGRIDIGALESQPNPLAGDYNFDLVVDVADYAVWRHTAGSSNDLRADGNADGIVNQDDYNVWRALFGQTLTPVKGINSFAAGVSADSATSQATVDSARTQRPATLTNVPSDSATSRQSRPRQTHVLWDDLLETSPTDRRRTLLDWQATRGHDDQSVPMLTSLTTRNGSADFARGDHTFESIDNVFQLLGSELQQKNSGTLFDQTLAIIKRRIKIPLVTQG
jgi:hypothetical protein